MEPKLLPVTQKAYDLNRWLLARVAKFSRDYKFTLGDRLQTAALDLQMALVEAGHARAKDRPLFRASQKLDQLRLLLRLARDLNLLSPKQHRYASAINEELGRMLGGWLRSLRARQRPGPA